MCDIMAQLTRRQREVLSLKAAGLTYREIARQLNISYRTAERHAHIASGRTGKTTTQLAVAVAIDEFKRGIP